MRLSWGSRYRRDVAGAQTCRLNLAFSFIPLAIKARNNTVNQTKLNEQQKFSTPGYLTAEQDGRQRYDDDGEVMLGTIAIFRIGWIAGFGWRYKGFSSAVNDGGIHDC